MYPLSRISPLLIATAASAALAADPVTATRVFSMRSDDPQLSLRATTTNQPGNVGNVGLGFELPPDALGKTRLEVDSIATPGAPLNMYVLDQRLMRAPLDAPLFGPGALDLGVQATHREMSTWDLALKPNYRMEYNRLAFNADASLGRLAVADNGELGARYALTTSYTLNPLVSLGVNGHGEFRRNGVRTLNGMDQVTPVVFGRYLIDRDAMLRYNMGWSVDPATGARAPNVQLNLDLHF
jgi:hypothetical protein